MHEVPFAADGMSRREVLRRGAALGAALAVTTPTVQALGQVSAFAQESPQPGNPPSHIQLLVTWGDDETKRGVKWDPAEGWGSLQQQGNRCWDPSVEGFQGATATQVGYLNANATVQTAGDTYRVTVPSIVEVVNAAATFDGGNCFELGTTDGPFWDGAVLVFPKPSSGQGSGSGD